MLSLTTAQMIASSAPVSFRLVRRFFLLTRAQTAGVTACSTGAQHARALTRRAGRVNLVARALSKHVSCPIVRQSIDHRHDNYRVQRRSHSCSISAKLKLYLPGFAV